MSYPDGPEPNTGEVFDIRSLESPNLRILREAFERVEAINRHTLDTFDPNELGARTPVVLETDFPEAELDMPELAALGWQRVLDNLGLAYEELAADDPQNIFQFTYGKGEVDQIRLVTRTDGVEVPVWISLGKDEENNPINHMELLSHDQVDVEKKRLQDHIEKERLRTQLETKLGFEGGFLKLTELSLDEMSGMLKTLEQIQNEEVVKPDTQELEVLRQKLVRAMLPSMGAISALRRHQLPKLRAAYEKELTRLMRSNGFDTGSALDFARSERMLRLHGLNEQLRRRRQSAKLGTTVMTSFATVCATGVGSVAGDAYAGGSNVVAAIGGAIVLGAGALGLGIQHYREKYKRAGRTKGFVANRSYEPEGIANQLRDELHTAKRYLYNLKHNS